jgi:hypothetical protein
MASDTHRLRFWRLAGSTGAVFGAAFVLASGLLGTAPAAADDNMFSSVLGFFGGQNNDHKAEQAIDYRPRPPIVVPPSRDLPPPQQASAHGADWPTDPDAAARRRAEADSRRPAPRTSDPVPVSPTPIKVKMKDCPAGGVCDDDSFWEKMKATFTGTNQEGVLNGTEPKREYLYEPPPGYRAPLIPSPIPPVPTQAHKDTHDSAEGVRTAEGTKPRTSDTSAQLPVQSPTPMPNQPPAQPPAQKDHLGLW